MKRLGPLPSHHEWTASALCFCLAAGILSAQTAVDEDSPWPRIRSTNGNTVVLHLPQVERWTSRSFTARAAVEVKPAGAKTNWMGVVWFDAHGSVDRSNGVVTLERIDITKARFPDTPDNGSNALALVRATVPAGARTVSLDYLVTALGFIQAAARQGPAGLKHTPPDIFWVTNRTVLVRVDGEPLLKPIAGTDLERVMNTPALLVRDRTSAKFYLAGDGHWYAADSLQGPWSWVQTPPASVATLAPASAGEAPDPTEELLPRILVRTKPAELLTTAGLPDYRPIRGTALQYAADAESPLFFHTPERDAYLLISGRWYKAKSLHGPWTHVAPTELPADFARIPAGSPQAIVLASVPDTPQAELAIVANSVPVTATVNRLEAKLDLTYDGEPQFKPIEDTRLSYAVNAPLPVIQHGDRYYALDNGVWFVAASAKGPWEVAAEVPEELYSIPPSSPVYYATYAHVYQADEEQVEVGYTAGYQGAYEDSGTVVYGTGWDYEPWLGNEYYGWGWTWGYSYVYVPWYQWWIWRPWWNRPGGLRAALIDNVYDRWQGRNGVTPYDRPMNPQARAASETGFSGHPALYGRFRGTPRPAPLLPPPNTLALNPYTRPQNPARPGDVPNGAQLLSAIQRAPGGGRDLYASPDGNVYLRKKDGWYRRQPGGDWGFYAALPGSDSRGQRPAGVGPGAANRSGAGRNVAQPGIQGRAGRVPDSGYVARAQDIAALERQYYARALSQARAQQHYKAVKASRPAKIKVGGGRRR
jgi:hypothetical protein